MQATITYLLTEQAQRAQMAATGQPVARKQALTVDVPTEDLGLLQVRDDGTPYLDLTGEPGSIAEGESPITDYREPHTPYTETLKITGCPTVYAKYRRYANASISSQLIPLIPYANADVIALIKQGLAKEAVAAEARKRKGEEEAAPTEANARHNRELTELAYRAFLADPEARCSSWYDSVRKLVNDLRSPSNWWPESHIEFVAEIKRRNDADDTAKKAAEAAKEQAKTDYIAQWITERTDEQTRMQFDDGLLCRQTALSLIADAAFANAGVPEKAQYDDSFCRDSKCPCGSKTLDCLPTTVYPRWKAINNNLPDGFEVSFKRVRECLKGENWDGEGESAGPTMYLAEIKLPHRPFVFERTVKL